MDPPEAPGPRAAPHGGTYVGPTPIHGIAVSPRLQQAVALAICASAAIFIGSAVWQLLLPIAPALGLVLGGWFLASLLEPVVSSLQRHAHAPRQVAVLGTLLIIVVALGVAWVGLGPLVSSQVSDSLDRLPAVADGAAHRAVDTQAAANEWFNQRHIALQLDLFSTSSLERTSQRIATRLEDSAISPLAILGGVLGMFGTGVLTLVLAVLFLIGGRHVADELMHAAGPSAGPDVEYVFTTFQRQFGTFLRAELIQGVLYAIAVWICLVLLQVEGAPAAAMGAGVLLLIPVVGAPLAIVVPVVVALASRPDAWPIVLVFTILLQQVVLNVVGPRLMGRGLGIPPLLVLIAVLAGAHVAGVWGAILAVPILGTALDCAKHFRARWESARA